MTGWRPTASLALKAPLGDGGAWRIVGGQHVLGLSPVQRALT